MSILKRNSDHLSPPITDLQKKYLWNPESLIEKNKFYLPSHLEPSASNDDTTTKEPPKIKIPPIFLHGPINHKEVTNDIKKLTKAEFSTSLNSTTLKISLTTTEDYRTLAKHYTDNKIQYHTYQDPNGRPLSVIIKNVPPSLTEEDILEELAKYNLPIIRITRLLNKDKTPMPVCAVLLTANEKANEIFNISRIFYSIVTIEPRRNNNTTPQCHRCQRIGHTKNYCKLEPRCVKCQGHHLYTDCDKPPQEPPTCVNCGEKHPANWRKCRYFTESINYRDRRPRNEFHKTTKTQNIQLPANNMENFPQLPRTTTQTNHPWQHKTNTPAPETSSLLNTLLQSLINLIQPYIEQIKQFILSNLLPSLLNGP